jgi:hypothetical protein
LVKIERDPSIQIEASEAPFVEAKLKPADSEYRFWFFERLDVEIDPDPPSRPIRTLGKPKRLRLTNDIVTPVPDGKRVVKAAENSLSIGSDAFGTIRATTVNPVGNENDCEIASCIYSTGGGG